MLTAFYRTITLGALGLITSSLAAQEAGSLTWRPAGDGLLDLVAGDRKMAQYVHLPMDPANREATYKPFHQVYDFDGKDFLTKGAGGKFTHHRGVYYGFSKTTLTTESGDKEGVDTWHCKRAYQQHAQTLESGEVDGAARQKVLIHWISDANGVFAHEERQLTFTPGEDTLIIDFHSKLSPLHGPLKLDGDPQHAGFQFRAANEVHEKTARETYFLRPGSGKGEEGATINWSAKLDDETTRDLAWKAMSFVVGGQRYTTLYLDRPSNPKPARFSERDYGRFGSYFAAEATQEKPLEVDYRLHVFKGEIDSAKAEALSATFLEE